MKNMILISLDRSKCTAHSNMLSSIPMEFKKMQNKFLIHMNTLYIWAINHNLRTFLRAQNHLCFSFPIRPYDQYVVIELAEKLFHSVNVSICVSP